MAARFIISRDERGGFSFALVAANGQTLAVGEGYPSKAACVNGIETVRRAAPDATLDDRTAPDATAEPVGEASGG